MNVFPLRSIARLVREALMEDLGPGDLTCEAAVPDDALLQGRVRAGERHVAAGLTVAAACFRMLDPEVTIEQTATEGRWVAAGECLMRVAGRARALLSAERTALNFLGRLSGIATITRQCVEAAAGTGARICDTRKTTPTLRILERGAVRIGGGTNHRFGLYDAVMLKDNHLALIGDPAAAVARVRARYGDRYTITVEVEDLEGLARALEAGPDVVLLDNMPPALLRDAVRLRDGRDGRKVLLEASGGILPGTVGDVARSGVDRISIGALTRSAPSIDVGLECQVPRGSA